MCPITVAVSGSVRIPLMIKECGSTVELLLTAENQGKQNGKRARPEGAYRDISPLILYFHIRRRCVGICMPRQLYRRQDSSVPTEQKGGLVPEPASKFWRGGGGSFPFQESKHVQLGNIEVITQRNFLHDKSHI